MSPQSDRPVPEDRPGVAQPAPEAKISRDELFDLFGPTIPMEVVALIWNAPPDKTIAQVRSDVRALAAHLKAAAQIDGQAKLACARRELALRRAAYPKWVANGRMKQEVAEREIAVMAAICSDYERSFARADLAGRLSNAAALMAQGKSIAGAAMLMAEAAAAMGRP